MAQDPGTDGIRRLLKRLDRILRRAKPFAARLPEMAALKEEGDRLCFQPETAADPDRYQHCRQTVEDFYRRWAEAVGNEARAILEECRRLLPVDDIHWRLQAIRLRPVLGTIEHLTEVRKKLEGLMPGAAPVAQTPEQGRVGTGSRQGSPEAGGPPAGTTSQSGPLPPGPLWVTPREYARRFGIAEQTLANWRYQDRKLGRTEARPGYPQYKRVGRSVRYRLEPELISPWQRPVGDKECK